MPLTWKELGKGVHAAKIDGGFYHVIRHGARVWSVTFNGRVVETAENVEAGKSLAEKHAADR